MLKAKNTIVITKLFLKKAVYSKVARFISGAVVFVRRTRESCHTKNKKTCQNVRGLGLFIDIKNAIFYLFSTERPLRPRQSTINWFNKRNLRSKRRRVTWPSFMQHFGMHIFPQKRMLLSCLIEMHHQGQK